VVLSFAYFATYAHKDRRGGRCVRRLTSDRVYRPAFPVRLAIDKMRAERARHFDPEVLDAFMAALPKVETIRRAYKN
jgi:response regulator RpfG family c-di-GMP phosphodiesterase